MTVESVEVVVRLLIGSSQESVVDAGDCGRR